MFRISVCAWVYLLLACCVLPVNAQQPAAASANVAVPPMVNFSGVLTEANGKLHTGTVGVTFYLYKDSQGGAPLWMETQNVQVDKAGHYTAALGSTTSEGLPAAVFASGEARWLGVEAQGLAEQPRVLLVAVPYAMKAADAETVGGMPPSAFVLAAPVSSSATMNGAGVSNPNPGPFDVLPPATSNVTTTGGTVNAVPLWTKKTNIQSSAISQTGSGTTAKIGIGTSAPATTLDVKGAETVRGALTLPATGTATATAGKNSQPQDFVASSFSSSTSTAVSQKFRWQGEPAANNTANPSGTLNLLYGLGATTPSETGLKLSSKGVFTFASGQTFPGTGTITGVTAGMDLTGGGTSGSVTLNLDKTKVPQLSTANTFTGNQTINGNLSATGTVTGSGYQIGSNLFAYGSYSNGNSLLGFAGNTTMTGLFNTASGKLALSSNTTGNDNTASGYNALGSNTTGNFNTVTGYYALTANVGGSQNTATGYGALTSNLVDDSTAFGYFALSANTTGDSNTAIGSSALRANTTGQHNTASGYIALLRNTSGNYNTAVGSNALLDNTTGNGLTCIGFDCTAAFDGLFNATAIGAHAVVGQSNSLVLGGTGKYAVKVGIGTATPSNILTIGQGLGHPVSDSWETYSSRRWKTNIRTLHGVLAKVEQLRGVSYDLREGGKHEVGVIAEEVGAVVPEVVTWDKNGKDAQSVDYGRLTALLIEATKEQQLLIQKQQDQIKAQAAQIARLTSQVKAIQATLKANSRTDEVRTAAVRLPAPTR
jgi:hypothetical protein